MGAPVMVACCLGDGVSAGHQLAVRPAVRPAESSMQLGSSDVGTAWRCCHVWPVLAGGAMHAKSQTRHFSQM